jgi:menaquinone-dependent protoporphyrinogen IX oxidase
MKAIIIYDSKYGNTANVAENILEGLKQLGGIEATIGYVKEVDPQTIVGYDALIIGAPNHMGKPSRTITKFVDSLSGAHVDAKWVAAFDTYFQRQKYFEKAMKKLEKHINKQLPNATPITSGLSVKVNGVNGPIADSELLKAKEFGKQLATTLRKNGAT